VTDDTLPTPPWRAPTRNRTVRPALNRDQIVDAAMRIVAEEGIDAVSMRRVAQVFDTGPSTLYAHIANKDELLQLMIDRINDDIEVPEPDPQRWQEQVKEVARSTYRALTAHGDVARAALANIPTGANALRTAEGLLAIMIAGGLSPRIAGWAMDRIFLYINADAYEGALYGAKVRASGKPVDEYVQDFFGQLADYFRSLPPDRFPNFAAHADALVSGDGDERFEFGLDMLVDGLARYVGNRDPSGPEHRTMGHGQGS
jgi:AcrR family transcriptional regulator